jgi:glycosyltransferase involved in cell wall biosynthesis
MKEIVMGPAVSLIVPCYNYGRFVGQAVDSLLSQTFSDLEIIAIDDASSDDSSDVLDRYRSDPRVTVVHHAENQGHIHTYNEGLRLAQGKYIGCLSADDYAARPDAVERQVALFERHPAVGFVYSAHELVDEAGRVRSVSRPWDGDYMMSGMDEFQRLIWLNYVPASGTLVRRECHDQLGWYDPRLPHAADWDLWLRITTARDVAYTANALYSYRIHQSNMSHTRVTPGQSMDEALFLLDQNFRRLASSASSEVLRLRPGARDRALLSVLWGELAFGRKQRSWQALASVVRRSPRLLADRALYSSYLRILTLTLMGANRYRSLFGGYSV